MKSALSQVLKDEDKRRLYDQVIVPSSLHVVSILSLMEYPCDVVNVVWLIECVFFSNSLWRYYYLGEIWYKE